MFENIEEAEVGKVSIVTPTFRRPVEIAGLLENLSQQILLPSEVILVDGAPAEERDTEKVVAEVAATLPFECHYIRHERGTAIQRNAGIDKAIGPFIAFIDDDVRLDPKFLSTVINVFAGDKDKKVGGIVGYRSGVRKVDFMTTACAVWRREVFENDFRFDPFFCDYGVLEDAHLSLRAGRQWELLQCGDAHCIEMSSPNGRVNKKEIGFKSVVNYYYVFQEAVRPLTWRHKVRFWRHQAFELLRITASAVRRRRRADLTELWGRLEGFVAVARGMGSLS
jgi:glycosyltransferase involved in cell wall biosynthesis